MISEYNCRFTIKVVKRQLFPGSLICRSLFIIFDILYIICYHVVNKNFVRFVYLGDEQRNEWMVSIQKAGKLQKTID